MFLCKTREEAKKAINDIPWYNTVHGIVVGRYYLIADKQELETLNEIIQGFEYTHTGRRFEVNMTTSAVKQIIEMFIKENQNEQNEQR